MLRAATIRTYEIIAFATGFALMAYELVASRLLSPTIGSSTYVWASIIGVIIAALTLGYAAGGWVADKRVAKQDIAWLLLGSAGAMALSLLLANSVITAVSQLASDTRIQGVTISLLLFMPASFLIGMVSPYLVRLRNESIATTGRSVATLSALNSLGGISGTFLAGFVFFGYVGSRETLGIVIGLLLASSWLVLPKTRTSLRIGLTAIIIICLAFSLVPRRSATAIATIDTAASRYTISRTTYNGSLLRVLSMGPSGYQSGVYENGSKALAFPYTQRMADITALAPNKSRILILGGGAFTLPEHLGNRYPDAHIDVVEIDPQLVRIARQYFFYKPPANVQVIAQDARAYINQSDQHYDVIMIDAYSDIALPPTLATAEYGRALKDRLRPGGIVIANFVGAATPRCAPVLGATHAAHAQSLPHYLAFPLGDIELRAVQNIIAVYSTQPISWLQHTSWSGATLPDGSLLTDNFAPTERLQAQCWG